MKKHLFSFGLLVLTLLATISLTSCGSDDDGPSASNVRASDLTAPWMLFEVNNTDHQAFWAFNGQQAASGIIEADGDIEDVTLYNSWSIEGGNLIVGGRNIGSIRKENAQGIDLIYIGSTPYLPSNVKVDGQSLEDELTEIGITRQLLWSLINNAHADD